MTAAMRTGASTGSTPERTMETVRAPGTATNAAYFQTKEGSNAPSAPLYRT